MTFYGHFKKEKTRTKKLSDLLVSLTKLNWQELCKRNKILTKINRFPTLNLSLATRACCLCVESSSMSLLVFIRIADFILLNFFTLISAGGDFIRFLSLYFFSNRKWYAEAETLLGSPGKFRSIVIMLALKIDSDNLQEFNIAISEWLNWSFQGL